MTPSPSAEPAKPKRKGTRRISTLTPSQLARKRAKDREAQRAIRARTKEHIERLGRELAALKLSQSCDQTVQELLNRNRALEEELMRLKENMRVQIISSLYSAPGLNSPQLSLLESFSSTSTFNDNLGTSSDAIPSPRGSTFPSDYYNFLPDYSQQHVPLSNNCESLASTVSCSSPSNVSTPSSSVDYNTGYISISLLSSILPSNPNSSSISVMFHKDVVEMEYNNVGLHSIITQGLPLPDISEESSNTQSLDAGFQLNNTSLQSGTPHSHRYISHHCHQHSAWKI
ncbi:hypothetical protein FOXG_16351 [Fusarium oxysporum f. sp. lycopersici 4287]|uniref:BZIP domain-containing protein n=2 Tax=Fusarium oxysporum TaxID=5507 RepID=A0A0J9UZK1_FUSO4|nr:hypothetical protein FOXG_06499 [Fusarium oxysporum f. sp. lycopersici 4287]XP_018242769.1 hypothetical protein FOXG_06763 [Fusarium oxysporum f. sp. lycopersici 4287]XP_018244696.1 hypothetical protein FOXG_07325 [Fusarium oxysporum f. sp. lycopersici 4287]XP_018256995.1 uncharacterized protein FOXG_16351 [Fusarium oxysporum f. sp. lycopersici 4287]KAJ9419228.1 hypothetical protein QL093DRAFT_2084102 [Fusarium oxysporum]KNB04365.1 hypothetical protein FOXG_06499 [Fusarium oxysporum f. sp. 